MSNFSYAVKILKAEFCAFMEPLTKGLARPKAKLLYDLVYGILRSGSARVSLIGKALCEQSSINVTENRLTQAIAKGDPMPVAKKLSSLSFSMCPGFVCCDETDIQKPFGKAFECLDDVQDGSAGGRPIGRGYHVVGMAGIGGRNSPMPLCLWAYSCKASGFVSQFREHEALFPEKGLGKAMSMDRGYDSKEFMWLCRERGFLFALRATSKRKYSMGPKEDGPKRTCFEIADSIKGRYAFRFEEPDKPEGVEVKASAVRVSHERLPGGIWLLVERFPDEREPRCYLTDVDCSTKAGCEKALKTYRLRWRIEECFRFLKGEMDMEGAMVRSLNAMNWILLAACAATAFLSRSAAHRTPAYWQCKQAFKSFAPEMTDEQIVDKRGHISVELYRLAGGAREILGHFSEKPTPKGRDRRKKGPIQLKLDNDLF